LGIATTIVASTAGAEARAGGRAGALFVQGLEETFRVSALLAAVGFVISLLWVGGSARSLPIPAGTPTPAPTQTAAAPELA
jgi:hypothetical protein